MVGIFGLYKLPSLPHEKVLQSAIGRFSTERWKYANPGHQAGYFWGRRTKQRGSYFEKTLVSPDLRTSKSARSI